MKITLVFVLTLTFGIVLFGVATLHSGLVILAIPLLAYLFAAVYQRPEAIKLTILREVSPDNAPQGTPITVKLTIHNQGAELDELAVRDLLPHGVKHLSGESTALVSLAPQGKLELEYTVEAVRGEYDRYELIVYARDFMNFFEQPLIYRTVPHLLIHPRYPKLERIPIRPPQTRGFAGPIAARQGGSGIDFWSVREYQTGDPQRQINWKLSARSERDLYTNIFEQERVADVGVILDARERTNVLTSEDSLFEHGVKAAAALAQNFLDDGNRVSLMIYGAGISRIFPGYGRVQRDRILDTLAKASPGMNYALESLTRLPTRFFPTKSQLVLISPLIPEDISVILGMRAYGYAVIVISPNPIAFEANTDQDFAQPAYRLAFAERSLMLRQVRRSGAQVVDWRVDQPLEQVIREALARQPLIAPNYRSVL